MGFRFIDWSRLSLLNSVLDISGNTLISGNTWMVYYDYITVDSGSVVPINEPEVINDTLIDFSVVLDKPGDYYEFTFDVVNGGSIDAMIEKFSITGLIDNKLLDYQISWLDGIDIDNKQILESNSKDTILVYVEYNKDIDGSDLMDEDLVVDISISTMYQQSDDTGIIRPKEDTYFTTTKLKSKIKDLYEWKIEMVTTLDRLKVLSNALDSWDISYNDSCKIMAYTLDEDNNSIYELYMC